MLKYDISTDICLQLHLKSHTTFHRHHYHRHSISLSLQLHHSVFIRTSIWLYTAEFRTRLNAPSVHKVISSILFTSFLLFSPYFVSCFGCNRTKSSFDGCSESQSPSIPPTLPSFPWLFLSSSVIWISKRWCPFCFPLLSHHDFRPRGLHWRSFRLQ